MDRPPDDLAAAEPNLVRPYTLTAGRTDSRVHLPMQAPVQTLESTRPPRWPASDVRSQILTLCADSPSVAEIAAQLSVPLGVARVLIGDLVTQGYLRVQLVTNASAGVDGLEATPMKKTTTVAMDFGRIALDEDLVLYVFGTPGQRRFWFMWDDLVRGAIGAIILVDMRRLQDSFAAIDFFEARNLPFLIAINEFDGAPKHPTQAVRRALALPEHIPVITVDARDRQSAKAALIAITEYALDSLTAARR